VNKRELDHPEKPKSQLIHVINELVRNKAGLVSVIFLFLMIGCSILAPILTSYDPVEIDAYNTLKAPDSTHYFGTDDTGRDIYSRVLWGGRISLRVGIISAGISTIAGLILGLISGYFGGAVSFVILRFMDLLLAFPGVLLALFIVATLGPSLDNVMIAIGIAAIPSFTRVIHGCVLSAKEDDYIKAAVLIGCSHTRIIIRHVIPNIMAPVIVLCTLQVGNAIFGAASLSFIGLGAQPPIPEWGAMVSRGRYNLDLAMWISTFPGIAIALVVISINIIGDVLRDALDPFLRER